LAISDIRMVLLWIHMIFYELHGLVSFVPELY
jgi:hypothetical protein